VTGVHHIAFRTSEIDRLCSFYERWLGLAIVRDERPRSVWLSVGEACVLMIEGKAGDEPNIDPKSLELIAFHVMPEELTRIERALSDEGLLEGRTAFTLYFRDPDGRRVGVSTYPL
jgi:catechol 2,3-dioxygenase-like lactoylglutathione lyase family enzyme